MLIVDAQVHLWANNVPGNPGHRQIPDFTAEDLLKEMGGKLPAGRIAEPEEIAHVVAFLASEPCSYMYGSSIYMDGGERRSTP